MTTNFAPDPSRKKNFKRHIVAPPRLRGWIKKNYRAIPFTRHPKNNILTPIKFSHFKKVEVNRQDRGKVIRLEPVWEFQCKCGVKKRIVLRYWVNGHSKSCGCSHDIAKKKNVASRGDAIKATALRHKMKHIDTITFYLGNVHKREKPLKVTVFEAEMVWAGVTTIDEIIQKRKNQPLRKVA